MILEVALPIRLLLGAGLMLAILAAVEHRDEDVNECRFEQTWSAGDPQHYNEQFVFHDDAMGRWSQGGFAGDAPHGSATFTWSRSRETVTVIVDGASRTVPYELSHATHGCYLHFFEAHPIVSEDERGAALFRSGPL